MYCNQCGRKMSREAVFCDYFDNPVCKDCMVVDSNGDICPHCGKKVPFDYMVGNICRKCAEEED